MNTAQIPAAYLKDPDDLIEIDELCRRVKKNRRWVYHYTKRTKSNPDPLPVIRDAGRKLLFSWTLVCAWLERRMVGVPKMPPKSVR